VLFPTISAFGGLARRPAGRLAGRAGIPPLNIIFHFGILRYGI